MIVRNRLNRLEKAIKGQNAGAMAQRVQEVEAYMAEAVRVYNAPEARAERERQYQELKRIGELRKQAFESGRSMNEYPLPWEKGNQQ